MLTLFERLRCVSMERFVTENAITCKAERWKTMIESLSQLRTDGFADVTIHCGNKEFRAHKLVLQASSQYFLNMFRSGMEEAKSGLIVYDSIEPDTMEAVLNYIYLGDVSVINTEQFAVNVLTAAHMMELTDLTKFCFDALSAIISGQNCVSIWDIASVYDHATLKSNIFEYILANFKSLQLEASKLFVEISDVKVKELVTFAVKKQICLDDMLRMVLDWLGHDLKTREKFTTELFACLEAKFLSHDFVKSVLRDKKLMAASSDIANKMNELAVGVFVLSDGGRSQGVLRLVVTKLSEVTDLRSSPRMIQNLPWNFLIRRSSKMGENRAVGLFIECNRESKDQSWSCAAKVNVRLVSHNKNTPPIALGFEKLYCGNANGWGFSKFVKLDEEKLMLDSSQYLSGDTAIFEAEIIAEAPLGMCD